MMSDLLRVSPRSLERRGTAKGTGTSSEVETVAALNQFEGSRTVTQKREGDEQ